MTKIHASVSEGSLPVAVTASPANIHEGTRLIPLMESINIKHGRGTLLVQNRFITT